MEMRGLGPWGVLNRISYSWSDHRLSEPKNERIQPRVRATIVTIGCPDTKCARWP